MSYYDLIVTIIIGAVFILLGLVGLLWGRHEENTYYSSKANRADVREYLEHNPLRPEPGAIKIGRSVAIIIGIVLLMISGGFRLWGMA